MEALEAKSLPQRNGRERAFGRTAFERKSVKRKEQ